MYANVDGFTGDEPQIPLAERPEIDRWILSLLNTLVKTVTEEFDDYEPTRATRAVHEFVLDKLSNWYVRPNRKRFWSRGLERATNSPLTRLFTPAFSQCRSLWLLWHLSSAIASSATLLREWELWSLCIWLISPCATIRLWMPPLSNVWT